MCESVNAINPADHIALVYYVIKQHGRGWYTFDHEEVLSAGFMGLVLAAKHYDPQRGVKFSTYACVCIKRMIQRYVMRETKYRQRYRPTRFDGSGRDKGLSEEWHDRLEDVDFGQHVLEMFQGRDRCILYQRHWLDQTYRDIGQQHGFTYQRSQQALDRIHGQAKERLMRQGHDGKD